jgi:GT2 family glycosyltransferase
MTASLIIATRNRSAALRETLRALATVTLPARLGLEILVVDNGSTDDTRATVASATVAHRHVKYLHEPRVGKSQALNTALAAARGDVVVFLDDDVRPRADWLGHITTPILERRCDALAGAVRLPPHLSRPWMKPAHFAWLASTDSLDSAHPQSAVGANMAVARRVLDRVPRFDAELGPGKLGLWEDTLFSAQILRAGFRLGAAPLAIVEHHFDSTRLTRRSFLAHAKNQGRSAAYVAWHWDHATSGETSPFALGYRLKLLAKRVLRRRECTPREGIASWEMDLTCGIAFADQLRLERRRPRAYAKFGSHKLLEPALRSS